jgi:hypothetical protein
VAARDRVVTIIDEVSAHDLIRAIKRAPSLRGMILGYIAEEMFEKHVLSDEIFSDIRKHDDHDRSLNKADRDFIYSGRRYSIQLKSIQTNSISWDPDKQLLFATVQNDASDRRKIKLPNGESVETTNYKVGDYDVLAVPLFPFTGTWDFAYKLNKNCRRATSYAPEINKYLLSTTESIHFPLDENWTADLLGLLGTRGVGTAL